MKKFFAFILGAIVGMFAAIFVLGHKATSTEGKPSSKTKKISKKEKAKQNILELLSQKSKVTNNNVEELLGVSDATATNYLSELEEEGLVVQKGAGRGTHYVLKNG